MPRPFTIGMRSVSKEPPATRLTHTLYHYDALRDYENVEVYTFVANNAQVERSPALLQRHDQQVWGCRGELGHGMQLAGLRSHFALGWVWSYNRHTRLPPSAWTSLRPCPVPCAGAASC